MSTHRRVCECVWYLHAHFAKLFRFTLCHVLNLYRGFGDLLLLLHELQPKQMQSGSNMWGRCEDNSDDRVAKTV